MEKILGIADEFYDLNDIQINKEKSELLLRSSNQDYGKQINIKFGCQHIKIRPTPKNDSIRVLGVWFNAFHKKSFVLNQVKTEIRNVCNVISRKRITDKHIKYIFNHIIIPRIEYRTQVTIFTENETNQMMVPIRKLFKNKLKFSKSAPNTILESNLIYNLCSIHDNQI
jgi:hypothetical protein